MVGLSNTSSGPTGALSYYLGTNFDVPHGFAGALFIGKIVALNAELGFKDFSLLYDSIDVLNTTSKVSSFKSNF